MKPIFPENEQKVFDKLRETLNDDQTESLVGFGADMYSMGLIKGAFVTLICTAIPTVIYGLNRLLRDHP